VIDDDGCRCGAGRGAERVSVGTKVVFRPARGPTAMYWMTGEVAGYEGAIHKISTKSADYWCEADDLVPESGERSQSLVKGTRVWALWLDGRWYPGTIDAVQGPLRHVTWDDGDAMWLEAFQAVILAAEAGPPEVGSIVIAQRWDGDFQPARVEGEEDGKFRVTYPDGEEGVVDEDDIKTFPPNPFRD
jgi:hypothetical protein